MVVVIICSKLSQVPYPCIASPGNESCEEGCRQEGRCEEGSRHEARPQQGKSHLKFCVGIKKIVLYDIAICLVCSKDLLNPKKQGTSKQCFRDLLVCGRARARATKQQQAIEGGLLLFGRARARARPRPSKALLIV